MIRKLIDRLIRRVYGPGFLIRRERFEELMVNTIVNQMTIDCHRRARCNAAAADSETDSHCWCREEAADVARNVANAIAKGGAA